MNILIIGAGAYGLALAHNLKGNITVYSSRKEEIDNLNNNYSCDKLFPGIEFSKNIKFTNVLDLSDVDVLVLAVPSNYFINVINDLKGKIRKKTLICIATKGLVNNEFSYNIVKKHLNTKNVCIISGPSFGIDLIKKQNIVLTLAGKKEMKYLFYDNVKIETISDLVGIQLCGVLKNIFAIGSGILAGVGVSESTKAAYLNLIINETSNIIGSFKGKKDTIHHACGIGDILLTCNSRTSRNFTFGYLVGTSGNYTDFKNNNTVEGIESLISIKELFRAYHKSSEIVNIIYDIIFKNGNTDLLVNYIIK